TTLFRSPRVGVALVDQAYRLDDAGVVHEDVDAPVERGDLRHQPIDLARVGHVAAVGGRRAAGRYYLFRHREAGLAVTRRQRDGDAAPRQLQGYRATDPSARARDDPYHEIGRASCRERGER